MTTAELKLRSKPARALKAAAAVQEAMDIDDVDYDLCDEEGLDFKPFLNFAIFKDHTVS